MPLVGYWFHDVVYDVVEFSGYPGASLYTPVRVLEGGCGVGVVECDVGGCLVVVSHGCKFGFDWFGVVVVGVVDCVVVGAVKCGDDVF